MPSNTELVGKVWSSAFTFDKRVASGYAAATDDVNPNYADAAAFAPPMSVVTATIPHGVAQVFCDAELIGDLARLMRLLHAEEDIRWFAPLAPGGDWTVEAKLVELEQKSTGEILKVVTTVRDASKSVLAVSESSLFIREKRPDLPKKDDAGRTPTPQITPEHTMTWTVAANQSERYAEASGDHNPIHLDDALAQASGLRGRILHGLCTMAFAQRAVIGLYADNRPERLKRLRVRFARPVYMGDTLTCGCQEAVGTDALRKIELVVKNQDNHAVLTHGFAEIART